VKVIERRAELELLGTEVVLVAYDEPSLLGAKALRGLELPFPLLLDRTREAYARWGMGRARPSQAFLSPVLSWRYLKLLLRGERFLGFAPDMLQLGGDFVVSGLGVLLGAYPMRHNGDRVDTEVLIKELELAARAR